MKRVLVIPAGEDERFWQDSLGLSGVAFFAKYSPGSLVAEFEGKINREHLERIQSKEADCVHVYQHPRWVPGKYQDARVLLLVPEPNGKARPK